MILIDVQIFLLIYYQYQKYFQLMMLLYLQEFQVYYVLKLDQDNLKIYKLLFHIYVIVHNMFELTINK
jgi:hypothetical protein